jgi:hypothetical protein
MNTFDDIFDLQDDNQKIESSIENVFDLKEEPAENAKSTLSHSMDNILGTLHKMNLSLIFIAVGIWILVFASFFPRKVTFAQIKEYDEEGNKQGLPVKVVNIPYRMEVEGSVSVDNTVDVNLHEINGHRDCFYNSYSRHPNDYYRIPIIEY